MQTSPPISALSCLEFWLFLNLCCFGVLFLASFVEGDSFEACWCILFEIHTYSWISHVICIILRYIRHWNKACKSTHLSRAEQTVRQSAFLNCCRGVGELRTWTLCAFSGPKVCDHSHSICLQPAHPILLGSCFPSSSSSSGWLSVLAEVF